MHARTAPEGSFGLVLRLLWFGPTAEGWYHSQVPRDPGLTRVKAYFIILS